MRLADIFCHYCFNIDILPLATCCSVISICCFVLSSEVSGDIARQLYRDLLYYALQVWLSLFLL